MAGGSRSRIMTTFFEHSILINAPSAIVWQTLTDLELMRQWMGEPEMALDVQTDWTVGGPILIKGFHHATFENKGVVSRFEPTKVLRYSQLSSLSRLPDRPESYSVVELRLASANDATLLTVNVSGFPTESIFRHLDFYWRGTLVILKQCAERS
jgi:uncharacterized protein YndB with AHSA1/START domain